MMTTIILALAVLTPALVGGVFVVALIELDEIDEISGGSQPGQGKSLFEPLQAGGSETVKL